MTKDDLAAALPNANLQAFLHVIRAGEGTADDDGYRRCFGGELFDDFADHPRRLITKGRYTSTAAGCYQFLSRTWDGLVRQYGFADFSPLSQDLAAVALVKGRGALDDAMAGRITQAIAKCAREWASLPGSPYGQPVRTMQQALATYAKHGGILAGAEPSTETVAALPTPAKETTMPLPLIPILGALLPSLVEAIPKLGTLFGSGSAVQERNLKTAELAVQIVQDSIGARNALEAVEMVKDDPALAQAATKAIEDNWFRLTESGGGGIDGARKADQAASSNAKTLWDVWKSPSLIVACLLLPLVYLVVLSLIGVVGTAEWSQDVRASLAGIIVGSIIGGLIGYYYGQTTSNNRSPPAAAQ